MNYDDLQMGWAMVLLHQDMANKYKINYGEYKETHKLQFCHYF